MSETDPDEGTTCGYVGIQHYPECYKTPEKYVTHWRPKSAILPREECKE